MGTKLDMDICSEGDVAIASFKTPCISDVEAITNASNRVREYVQGHPVHKIVFDFSGVKFFSSQVLGLLLEARGYLQGRHGKVVVCSLESQLHRVFRITSLDRIFSFFPNRRAAIDEPAER